MTGKAENGHIRNEREYMDVGVFRRIPYHPPNYHWMMVVTLSKCICT